MTLPQKGHLGVSKMYASLKDELYWPDIYGDVENYVDNCCKCFLTRGKLRKHATLLKLPTPTGQLRDIAMDLLRTFPKTNNGKTHHCPILQVCSSRRSEVDKRPQNRSCRSIRMVLHAEDP